MSSRARLLGALLVCALTGGAAAAGAETLVWAVDDPFADGDEIVVEMGAELQGITGVEIRIEGDGGGWNYHCMVCCDPDGFGGTAAFIQTFELAPDLEDGPGAYCDAWAPVFTLYDTVLTPVASAGHEDWDFLSDGVMTLSRSYVHGEYPYGFPYCTGISLGSYVPTVTRLEITVTCATVVGEEASSWGAVKALFR